MGWTDTLGSHSVTCSDTQGLHVLSRLSTCHRSKIPQSTISKCLPGCRHRTHITPGGVRPREWRNLGMSLLPFKPDRVGGVGWGVSDHLEMAKPHWQTGTDGTPLWGTALGTGSVSVGARKRGRSLGLGAMRSCCYILKSCMVKWVIGFSASLAVRNACK